MIITKYFFVLLLSIPLMCRGQHFECLKTGVKQYYTNANGYMRVMKIDSVGAHGDSTTYYPYRCFRSRASVVFIPGSYPSYVFWDWAHSDSIGGGWLGKRVVSLADGRFVFDSYWNDSVVIRTAAHTGDSWTFYKDSSGLSYLATVDSEYVATIPTGTDSVKRIILSAYNASTPLPADSLNGFTILLSKSHGFVQVMDLYMFPYHPVDAVYTRGLDFYLDRSTLSFDSVQLSGGHNPGRHSALFSWVDFNPPCDTLINQWQPGDLFEYQAKSGRDDYYEYSNCVSSIFDSVASRTVFSNRVELHIVQTTYGRCDSHNYFPISGSLDSVTSKVIVLWDSAYNALDSHFLPETWVRYWAAPTVYILDTDTLDCVISSSFIIARSNIPGGESGFTSGYGHLRFKPGLGKVSDSSDYKDYEVYNYQDTSLVYYRHNGITCGAAVFPAKAMNVPNSPDVRIWPNPAQDFLNVQSATAISSIVVTTADGKIAFSQNNCGQQLQLPLDNWPRGCYFVCIDHSIMQKFIKL